MKLEGVSARSLGPLDLDLGQHGVWCFLGGNGSGKSLLAAVLAGHIEPRGGRIVGAPTRRDLVSFEATQARYEAELRADETNFTDEVDAGSNGLQILRESGQSDDVIRACAAELGLEALLERGCRLFSSGEWRRVELARAALEEPELLVLDEPLESLDADASQRMLALLERLLVRGTRLVLLVNRPVDVPPFCTHVAVLSAGRLVEAGPREEVLRSDALAQLLSFDPGASVEELDRGQAKDLPSPLVSGRGLSVRYGDVVQFAPFDLDIEPGQHLRIVGPNGSGKSTLLGLITGDHPQCYSNDLRVVGYRRGSGESIWDVKRRIGIVSPALHRDYRVPGTALTVVLSGFFDSIGLYEEPSLDQIRLARRFLALFDLDDARERPFHELSYGQQRLVLTARALSKRPALLVLDEPTQGLDAVNAELVLRYFGRVAAHAGSTILFVSHRHEEAIVGVGRVLRFVPSTLPGTRFEARFE